MIFRKGFSGKDERGEKNGKALPVFKLWFVRELTTLKRQ